MNLWEYAAKQAETPQEAAQEPQDGAETVSLESIAPLLIAQERRTAEQERALQICKEKQEATVKSAEARTAILKGLQAGEPPEKLLLIAVDCISAITGDNVFSAQSRKDMIEIYGMGLLQPQALQIELDEVRTRLAMLQRPELDAEPEDSRRRIAAAIRAHQRREREIISLQARSTRSAKGACSTAETVVQ